MMPSMLITLAASFLLLRNVTAHPATVSNNHALQETPSAALVGSATAHDNVGILAKRDETVEVFRQARIQVRCPFYGHLWKTFKWKARFNYDTNLVHVDPLDGIDEIDHVETSANNFSTRLHAVDSEQIEEFCCSHEYSATLTGSVHFSPRGITSAMVGATSGVDRIKVTELCMHNDGRVCVPPGATPPFECHVIRVSQGRG